MSAPLKPRKARGNVFAADRNDLEDVTAPPPLGDLMPKTSPRPDTAAPTPQCGHHLRLSPEAKVDDLPSSTHPGPARNAPARIPSELYARTEAMVKGPGRPSWGQLVLAACTQHRTDVIAEVSRGLVQMFAVGTLEAAQHAVPPLRR